VQKVNPNPLPSLRLNSKDYCRSSTGSKKITKWLWNDRRQKRALLKFTHLAKLHIASDTSPWLIEFVDLTRRLAFAKRDNVEDVDSVLGRDVVTVGKSLQTPADGRALRNSPGKGICL
jgi:hypothetical protein